MKLRHSYLVITTGTTPSRVKGELARLAGGDSGRLLLMFGRTGLCRTYGNSLLGKIY